MTVRTEFPRRVREIEHSWIVLAYGTRLAARIWLPDDAARIFARTWAHRFLRDLV